MIRLAAEADLTSVHGLEQVLFPDDAWPFDKLDDDLRSPYAHFLIAEDEDRVVGYAIAQYLTGNDVADIQNIAVVESHRRRGVGAELLDALVSWTVENGASAIMLEVRDDNVVAQSLYASRGFEVIATRPKYYQPSGVDALVMRREVSA
ncbi:MAG: tRNA ((37)-N6)-threonylcarbamoyltransferase complex transferase subunit TsaD [Actinomycetota bacterium]|jgi:ribosomal-protein-alanine acetyltransferase